MSGDVELNGPDFTSGVPLSDIPDGGLLLGHAQGKPVMLSRRGAQLHALDALCTHYGAPLTDGLVVGETVRCPWHHACFDLRSGEAVRAPALRSLGQWDVERRGDRIFVTGERRSPARGVGRAGKPGAPDQAVVIVGAGAAGDAAADMLRREGHRGPLTLIGDDDSPPVDRPNLSKDYLAGNAPEEWIPLRAPDFYSSNGINLILGRGVRAIERDARRVLLDDGSAHGYDTLLLATGAVPIRLPDAVSAGRIMYLRTLADSRAIIAAAATARRAVIVGASFIGLEVAAALRARQLEVHVVAPETHPLEKVMGRAISDVVRRTHEANGVVFHLGRSLARRIEHGVSLDDGSMITADLVVAGIGVRPNDQLARDAGLAVDRGIIVDEYLATSDPAIYAAGDVARYPDARTGDRIRVEHWVVAQRQGQAAARNILGARSRYMDIPFFWSNHFDMTINYVGHAEAWDTLSVEGDVAGRDAAVSFLRAGQPLAVATLGRDRAALDAELQLERLQAAAAGAR